MCENFKLGHYPSKRIEHGKKYGRRILLNAIGDEISGDCAKRFSFRAIGPSIHLLPSCHRGRRGRGRDRGRDPRRTGPT